MSPNELAQIAVAVWIIPVLVMFAFLMACSYTDRELPGATAVAAFALASPVVALAFACAAVVAHVI